MRRLLAIIATTLAAILSFSLLSPAIQAEPGATVTTHTIPGADGVPLAAKVIEPKSPGPHPVLVMPTSWGVPNIEYVGAAAKLAYESGYVVVSYTARGFYQSGGGIEVAGPQDVGDASKVIDWALANTDADAHRVGMAGISYGAGISALTAAADPRVRAISAMSGWADLERSLYPNQTVSKQAVEMLFALGHLTGRPSPALQKLEDDYRAGRIEDALPMAAVRSPTNVVDALNKNGTAVMIGNAWEDSVFPPQQMADLYKSLHGPKRLMLTAGDHAGPELFGAAGLPNDIWESTNRWFDHHLRGVPNGIDTESPVQLKPINSGERRGYPDWPSATGKVDTRFLGGPEQDNPFAPATGSLAPGAQPDWDSSVEAGVPTLADSGTVMVSGMLQGFFNIPVGVSVPFVDRRGSGVWATEPYPTAVNVSGAPHLRTTVTPTAPNTSLFAYLYDVDQLGNGSLITHKPMTLRDAAPGQPQQVDIGLEPASWKVQAGHRLVLVVDTVDPRYDSESSRGSQVKFSSSAQAPSQLDIPLG